MTENLPATAQSDMPLLIVPCVAEVSSVSAMRSTESVLGEPMPANRRLVLTMLPSGGQLPRGSVGLVALAAPGGSGSGFGGV